MGSNGQPAPPAIELHKELIPKNIEIIRCYYSKEIVPPDTTFGFDINGSGFTSEFQKMITVESGISGSSIQIKNLKLITANQIHGDMVVGTDAPTTFVYPRVLIKGLPVFSAPDPFAIVRKGEVLTVIFVSMEESGRAGRFRVITNLDDDLFKQFQVAPSTPGLEISDIQPRLPYVVEGTLRIGPGVPPGGYGLVVKIGTKEAYRRDGMIRIVRPNIGQSGFIQGVEPEEKYYRPGDTIQLYVQGTGLSAQDINSLDAHVDGFDMGKGSFTYVSGIQVRVSFSAPSNAPPGAYGLNIVRTDGQALFQKKNVFTLVPANWIAAVQVSPPVHPGQKGQLRILGRDLSPQWVQHLRIDLDEPGISVTELHPLDKSTLTADITVSSSVAPGDYWLHLSSDGQKIEPAYGSIIKVEAP